MRKLTVLIGAAALAVAGLAAPAGADPGLNQSGELRIFSLEPETLHPGLAGDMASQQIVRQLFRGLVEYDADGQPVLDQAQQIEQLADQEWLVQIRPGLTFTDGSPVDAAAYARGWEQAAAGPSGHLFDRITSVDASGNELVVTLSEPDSRFPILLGHTAFSPLPDQCEFDPEACATAPTGNGPYELVDWVPGGHVVLVRNEFYHDPGRAVADQLTFRIYPDVEAGCAGFLGFPAELDLMHPFDCEAPIIFPPPFGVFSEVSNTFSQLGLPSYVDDPDHPAIPLDNPDFRRALSLAIDWAAIAPEASDPSPFLADSLVSPHIDGYRPGACDPALCGHDPELALALFESAGGEPGAELTLWAPAGSVAADLLPLIGDQLNDTLGINYTLEVNLAPPEYLAALAAGAVTGPYWSSFDPDYPAMDAYLEPQFHSAGSANFSAYQNPDVDGLLAEAAASADPQEATALRQLAEDVVLEELPVIPAWFDQGRLGHRTSTVAWNAFHGPEYGLIAPPA